MNLQACIKPHPARGGAARPGQSHVASEGPAPACRWFGALVRQGPAGLHSDPSIDIVLLVPDRIWTSMELCRAIKLDDRTSLAVVICVLPASLDSRVADIYAAGRRLHPLVVAGSGDPAALVKAIRLKHATDMLEDAGAVVTALAGAVEAKDHIPMDTSIVSAATAWASAATGARTGRHRRVERRRRGARHRQGGHPRPGAQQARTSSPMRRWPIMRPSSRSSATISSSRCAPSRSPAHRPLASRTAQRHRLSRRPQG